MTREEIRVGATGEVLGQDIVFKIVDIREGPNSELPEEVVDIVWRYPRGGKLNPCRVIYAWCLGRNVVSTEEPCL